LNSAMKLSKRACSPVAESVDLAPPLNERYKGPYADMKSAYRWLLGVWLANSGYEADDAPIFEAYLNSPMDVPPTDLLTKIHLPLKAA
jgi:AraC family transcriptional regulator